MTGFRLLAYRESRVDMFPLADDKARWVIGRAADCDLRLADPTVSRHHVILTRDQDAFAFEDRGSNPVLLNGVRQARGPLPSGTPLLVGGTILYLERGARDATVRLEDADPVPAGGVRRYLDPDTRVPSGPPVGAAPHEAVEWLAAFLAAPPEDSTREQAASGLLDATMRMLGFGRGLLGIVADGADVEILASRSRDGSPVVAVPRGLMQELRLRGRPFLQPVTALDGRDAHLAIPLGTPLAGVLVLGRPDPAIALDDSLLRTASRLGELLWSRLREFDERVTLRDQFERLAARHDSSAAALAASARLTSACAEIEAAAAHSLPVFLIGEDGTEKEELARRLHALSDRAAQPFVTFHASIVAGDRVEEELFGSHSQTYARPTRALLRAQGGTLFLDQPDQLPAHTQDRLARALGDRALRLADGRQIPLDVRIVAASTDDPTSRSEAGAELRLALAEQLLAIRIDVPPLRACPEDAIALALLFLTRLPPAPDGLPRTLSERTRELLLHCPWPGNVRQLRRALEVAAARAGNRPIEVRDFPDDVRLAESTPGSFGSLNDIERAHIARVLTAVGGVKRRAAEILGIAPSTLYEKLRRFNIK